MKTLFNLSTLTAGIALTLSPGCQAESAPAKQLFLGGGHLVVCSSMTQAECADWDSYRQSALANLTDAEIRTPTEEPVATSDAYIERVINAAPWAADPQMQQAISNALRALQLQYNSQPIPSWDDFKAAMLALTTSDINVTVNGTQIDGEYLWYDASSDQWDALAYLKKDDGLITYTRTASRDHAAAEAFAGNTGLLDALATLPENTSFTYIDFITAIGSTYNNLSIEDQFRVLRLFRNLPQYTRPVEYVALNDSLSSDSVTAYNTFVEMAKTASGQSGQPHILVMTSSSNNHYDVADYYVQLFEQAGATVTWFPVDRAYRQSVDQNQCDDLQLTHDVLAGKPHQDIYFADYASQAQAACDNPETVLSMIQSADGLFINGGSQLRTLESLISNGTDSPEMAAIRSRFEQGALVIGGTSAGAAVQGGGRLTPNDAINPMIDGGTAYDVLTSGYPAHLMNAEGGLGVFNWGVTDTHFSERARQTRLIKLAHQQDVRFGFGVDETTALVVSQALTPDAPVSMSVVGQNGVYIADNATASLVQETPFWIRDITTHYLNAGDTFTWYPATETYTLSFNPDAALYTGYKKNRTITDNDILYQDHYRTLLDDMIQTQVKSAVGYSYEYNPEFILDFERSSNTVGAVYHGKASYQSVMTSITPQ
ncbi:MAG: cyanophycinase [Photobacterium halotolerans]